MESVKNNFDLVVTAAGRVNVIGEHIDYCGGKVLPAALSLKNAVYIRLNGTDKINLAWTDVPDRITLDIDRLESYKDVKYADYFAACAHVLKQAEKPVLGCDVLSDCTVPFGSGLSSSAAIEVSFTAALLAIAGEKIDPVEVALFALKAEREYIGMNCGVMDQYASACGKAGMAMLLDCATLNCEYLPFSLGEYALVILNSNKPHSLVIGKYNERRQESEAALAEIQKHLAVNCLAEVTPEAFRRVADKLPPLLKKRATHIVFENDRVQKATQALRAGDILALGALLRDSHDSLRDLYEVTGKELDALADAANAFPACVGARMTGGGFGGSAIALVQKDAVKEFESFVRAKYRATIGYDPTFYTAEIADGLTVRTL